MPLFVPFLLPGLQWYVDSRLGVAVRSSAGFLYQTAWADQGALELDLSQPITALQPLSAPEGPAFDGVDDQLGRPVADTALYSFIHQGPSTILGRVTATTTAQATLLSTCSLGLTAAIGFSFYHNAGTLYAGLKNNTGTGYINVPNTLAGFTAGEAHTVGMTVGTGDVMILLDDSTATDPVVTPPTGNATSRLNVSGGDASTVYPFLGTAHFWAAWARVLAPEEIAFVKQWAKGIWP
jgi:hypothetical protein